MLTVQKRAQKAREMPNSGPVGGRPGLDPKCPDPMYSAPAGGPWGGRPEGLHAAFRRLSQRPPLSAPALGEFGAPAALLPAAPGTQDRNKSRQHLSHFVFYTSCCSHRLTREAPYVLKTPDGEKEKNLGTLPPDHMTRAVFQRVKEPSGHHRCRQPTHTFKTPGGVGHLCPVPSTHQGPSERER